MATIVTILALDTLPAVDWHVACHGVVRSVATVTFEQRSSVSNWQPRAAQLI